MLNPTHLELTVVNARNLITKGKYDTNDAFVSISMGKDKFQTSVLERVKDNIEWNETFLLEIPRQGNTAAVILAIYHKKLLGDEFLGTISILLNDFQPSSQPKLMTYSLQDKPERANTNTLCGIRGTITVSIVFKQLSVGNQKKSFRGLTQDIIRSQTMKKSASSSSMRNVVQALMNEKRKLATPVMVKPYNLDINENEVETSLVRVESARGRINSHMKRAGESEFSSATTLNSINYSDSDGKLGLFLRMLFDKVEENVKLLTTLTHAYNYTKLKLDLEQILGQSTVFIKVRSRMSDSEPDTSGSSSDDPEELPKQYRNKSKMDLVNAILDMQGLVDSQQKRIQDLQEYIDKRLAVIMECNPKALEKL